MLKSALHGYFCLALSVLLTGGGNYLIFRHLETDIFLSDGSHREFMRYFRRFFCVLKTRTRFQCMGFGVFVV